MKGKINFFENAIMLGALFISIYIFLGHFKFPFATTYFLYAGVVFLIIAIILKGKINFDKGNFYYMLILLVTVIGCFYTKDSTNSSRQLMFFLIYGLVYFTVKQKGESFSKDFIKIYYIFSIIILISVYLQFLFSNTFNSILMNLLPEDNYLSIMRAFEVDRSYVGISPSVTVTSFSLGVLLFSSGIKFIERFFKNNVKDNKSALEIIVFMLALFGIIITNKRGIFISTLAAFFLSLIINRDISIKKLSKHKFVLMVLSLILIVVVGTLIFSNNLSIAHFISRFQGDNLLTGRDVLYTNAINSLNNNGIFAWIFGMGTGSAYTINATALHNVYLQIVYDHGIFGLIIFILFFGYNLKNSIKNIGNERFIQLAVQISFLIYCLSGNPLYSYYVMIPYLVFCVYKNSRKEIENEDRNNNVS